MDSWLSRGCRGVQVSGGRRGPAVVRDGDGLYQGTQRRRRINRCRFLLLLKERGANVEHEAAIFGQDIADGPHRHVKIGLPDGGIADNGMRQADHALVMVLGAGMDPGDSPVGDGTCGYREHCRGTVHPGDPAVRAERGEDCLCRDTCSASQVDHRGVTRRPGECDEVPAGLPVCRVLAGECMVTA